MCVEGNALLKSGVTGQNVQSGWRPKKDDSKWKKMESAKLNIWTYMSFNFKTDVHIILHLRKWKNSILFNVSIYL